MFTISSISDLCLLDTDPECVKKLSMSLDEEIIELNLSKCINLTYLYISNSNIVTLKLTNCEKLEYISIDNSNFIESLDLSQCFRLHTIELNENKLLKSINTSGLTQIKTITIINNQISHLDFTGFHELSYLYISLDPLESIILDCPKLLNLKVYYTKLTTIDLSRCNILYIVHITNNLLMTSFKLHQQELVYELRINDNSITHIDINADIFTLSLYGNPIKYYKLYGNYKSIYGDKNLIIKSMNYYVTNNGNNSI